MAFFRLLDQKPQYRLALGTLCANGHIYFYATGTTTPKNVYDAPSGISLGATIDLDSDGRHSEDLWLDDSAGAYRVDVKDSGGNSIPGYPLDNVRSADSSALAPPDPTDGTDGQALFTDGTAGGWYFDDVLTIPAQTGNSGKYLTTDGEALSWASFATDDTSGLTSVSATSTGYKWVDGVLEQWGSGTAPTAASLHTSVAITFGVAFDSAPWHVDPCPVLSSGVTSNSPPGFPNRAYSSPSTTGCTVHFFIGEENTGGTDTITSTIPFTWRAIGPKAVDPSA